MQRHARKGIKKPRAAKEQEGQEGTTEPGGIRAAASAGAAERYRYQTSCVSRDSVAGSCRLLLS